MPTPCDVPTLRGHPCGSPARTHFYTNEAGGLNACPRHALPFVRAGFPHTRLPDDVLEGQTWFRFGPAGLELDNVGAA